MERYRTTGRQPTVDKVLGAVRASGGKVLREPEAGWAPLELTIKSAEGEQLDLVAYAFTANKYRQGARPEGEHRFQIKYGSEFDRYHRLYLDPKRKRTTLMFGVHTERDLFIAVDPRMQTPPGSRRRLNSRNTSSMRRSAKAGMDGSENVPRLAASRRCRNSTSAPSP